MPLQPRQNSAISMDKNHHRDISSLHVRQIDWLLLYYRIRTCMSEQTVLITGCSSGVGYASALSFVEAGWEVYATARDKADIQSLDERGCHTATLDITNQNHIEEIQAQIGDEQERLDCIVNNTGFGQFGPVEDFSPEQFHRQFAVNVFGPHRLIREMLPMMREAGTGRIINISSVAGAVAFPGGGVYAGSKAALEAMSDALRGEVEPYGIDVIIIQPGPVKTNPETQTSHNSATGDATESLSKTEQSGAYSTLYAILTDTRLIGGDGLGAVDAEEVASDVFQAASEPDPRPRYQSGRLASIGVFAQYLPAQWRDSLYRVLYERSD
jgi:NAD(P)-dependent dehydrogenase (short-subunit alcohol dehydrogenase family)